jgi:hypothetical protein
VLVVEGGIALLVKGIFSANAFDKALAIALACLSGLAFVPSKNSVAAPGRFRDSLLFLEQPEPASNFFDACAGQAPRIIHCIETPRRTRLGQWPSHLSILYFCNSFGDLLPTFINNMSNADDAASDVLRFEAPATEPAVPIKLSLIVRPLAATPAIEISVVIRKRDGYPADLFHDKDVKAQILLFPGLELEDGTLAWSGDLDGDEVARFVARAKAVQDTEGTIAATVIGHAAGGRIDADKVEFHVSVQGDQIRVAPSAPVNISPLLPGTGIRVK